ncbi:hypothetical protein JW935_10240 [candidate division KSB1 bacterium]|nr:hypothetical protein [candidate division KSB1 bacterium]
MDFQLNSDCSYCVDIADIQFIDHTNNIQFRLPYPQAVVFDLLLKGYSKDTMVRMICKIALVMEAHAQNLIQDTITELKNKAILK